MLWGESYNWSEYRKAKIMLTVLFFKGKIKVPIIRPSSEKSLWSVTGYYRKTFFIICLNLSEDQIPT